MVADMELEEKVVEEDVKHIPDVIGVGNNKEHTPTVRFPSLGADAAAGQPQVDTAVDRSDADAGAGSMPLSPSLAAQAEWERLTDVQPKLAERKKSKDGKEHLFIREAHAAESIFLSEDKDELKRYLRLSRIMSKVATRISQSQGPEDILDWLWSSCTQFWSRADVIVKVYLQDKYAPESLTTSPLELAVGRFASQCGEAEELLCLQLRQLSNCVHRESHEPCRWFGSSTRSEVAEWEWVDLRSNAALRTSFEDAETVHDRLQDGRYRYPEHGQMDGFKSFVYIPLCVREDKLGVLMVASTANQEFLPADMEIYAGVMEVSAMHLKDLYMQYEMDRRRKEIENDRIRHKELAVAYRELLNDMLPSHVVDKLREDRTPLSSRRPPPGDTLQEGSSEAPHHPLPASGVPVPVLIEDTSLVRKMGNGKIRRTNSRRPGQPSHITAQLDKLTYAEYHDCVAILFSDVKGFTSLSEVADPAEIMLMLDDLFGRFDGIVERHAPAAYKVETIGDAYMIAFGLFGQTGFSEETPDDYAVALRAIVVGAEMIKESRAVNMPSREKPVEIRIGIQFGRIMSGIIGKKVPRYCMFGDTVNTASRMESTGVPGHIHVTDLVHHACMQGRPGRDLPFRSTGGLQVKGKGWMQTFILDPEQVLSLNVCPTDKRVKDMPFRRSINTRKSKDLTQESSGLFSAAEFSPAIPTIESQTLRIWKASRLQELSDHCLACFGLVANAMCHPRGGKSARAA